MNSEHWREWLYTRELLGIKFQLIHEENIEMYQIHNIISKYIELKKLTFKFTHMQIF